MLAMFFDVLFVFFLDQVFQTTWVLSIECCYQTDSI